MIDKKERKYEPSPSLLGSCPRKLVYYARDTEKRVDEYSSLRAIRGTTLHKMLPEVLDYTIHNHEFFKGVKDYLIIKTEGKVIFSWGTGTYDALVFINWGDHGESVIVDLKNYARVPNPPYDSNVEQVQAYIEGCVQNGIKVDRGLLLYFPDSGEPVPYWVERNPEIEEIATSLFSYVHHCIANNEFPERLTFSDRRCQFCAYKWTCWDEDLMKIAETSFKQDPIEASSLSLEIQNKLQEFLEIRDRKEYIAKDYKQRYGDMIKLMVENELYSVNIGTDRLTLVRCTKANGEFYYQIR